MDSTRVYSDDFEKRTRRNFRTETDRTGDPGHRPTGNGLSDLFQQSAVSPARLLASTGEAGLGNLGYARVHASRGGYRLAPHNSDVPSRGTNHHQQGESEPAWIQGRF